jgi:hypothetical protein
MRTDFKCPPLEGFVKKNLSYFAFRVNAAVIIKAQGQTRPYAGMG